MKMFRIVKQREKDQQVENDLRGLGHTSLFSDLSPEPVLNVERAVSEHAAVAAKLELAPSESNPQEYTCRNLKLSHKEKAINLFAFAVHLKSTSNVNSVLWEHQRFHEAIAEALETKHHTHQTPGQITTGLTLAPAIQLHLHQAGFHITPSGSNLTLSDHQVHSLLNEMKSPQVKGIAKAL